VWKKFPSYIQVNTEQILNSVMMKWHIMNNYPMLGLDVCCQL